MPESYFPPLSQDAFGVQGFNYDKFLLWLQGQPLNLKKSLTIQGDLISANWNGARPADLSSGPDLTATLGYYIDGDAGSAQFVGNVYFRPASESTEGAGSKLDFGDNFFTRVYQNNPTSGEDTLWIGTTAGDNLDHVTIGPTASGNMLKRIRLRARTLQVDWEDAGGDAASHNFPKGIIYNWGLETGSSGVVFDSTPDVVETGTANVPANVSVTIFVWGWFKFDNALSRIRAYNRIEVGGTLAGLTTASTELDLTTSAGGTGATGSGGTGATGSGGSHIHTLFDASFATYSTAGHHHAAPNGDQTDAVGSAGSHTHTGPSHTHTGPSHTHTLQSQEQTIHFSGFRSFTPTGSTVTIDMLGSTDSSSATAGGRHLMWMVVIN